MDGHDSLEAIPSIWLRRINATRARAILDRSPCADDRWADGYPTDGDLEAAGLALKAMATNPDTPFACYEIVDAAGVIVGGAGFHGLPSHDGVVEIGYGIAASVRNQGFARAAIGVLVAIASEHGARRVVARTDPSNTASVRALARNGFLVEKDDAQYVHHLLDLSLIEERST